MTLEEIEARAASLPPLGRQRLNEPAQKTAFIGDMVEARVAAVEASRRGILHEPAVRAQLDTFLAQKLYERELSPDKLKAEITEAELHQAFEANKKVYDRPESWRLSYLFLSAPASDAKGRGERESRARQLREEILKKLPNEPLIFERLASVHSDDAPSRAQDGLLGSFSKEELSQRFGPSAADAIATFKAGEVSEVLATDAGFHLFKVLGRKSATPFLYEEVKEDLTGVLLDERRAARQKSFIAKLKSDLKVELREEALGRLDLAKP